MTPVPWDAAPMSLCVSGPAALTGNLPARGGPGGGGQQAVVGGCMPGKWADAAQATGIALLPPRVFPSSEG